MWIRTGSRAQTAALDRTHRFDPVRTSGGVSGGPVQTLAGLVRRGGLREVNWHRFDIETGGRHDVDFNGNFTASGLVCPPVHVLT